MLKEFTEFLHASNVNSLRHNLRQDVSQLLQIGWRVSLIGVDQQLKAVVEADRPFWLEHLQELADVALKLCTLADDADDRHAAFELAEVELVLFLVGDRLVDQLPVVRVDVLKARALNEDKRVLEVLQSERVGSEPLLEVKRVEQR